MDDQLRDLVIASESVPDPLADPPEASVHFLDDLHLSDEDLDLLLGADTAGFRSLSDLRADGACCSEASGRALPGRSAWMTSSGIQSRPPWREAWTSCGWRLPAW